MIIRTIGNFHYLVRQPEHARHSTQILACLRCEFLGTTEEILSTVRATEHHDDGWLAWEAAPRLAKNGLPVDFRHMDARDHFDIWERSIFGAYKDHGPWAAALIARHGLEFVADHHPEMAEWSAELQAVLQEKAWPALAPEERATRLRRGFLALRFADAVSLASCADSLQEGRAHLMNAEGALVEHRLRRTGDWGVTITPWPFIYSVIHRVHLDATAVPVGEESIALDILKSPREYAVRAYMDFFPEDQETQD